MRGGGGEGSFESNSSDSKQHSRWWIFADAEQDEDSTYYYPHPPFSVPIPRGLDREFPIAARTTPGLSV